MQFSLMYLLNTMKRKICLKNLKFWIHVACFQPMFFKIWTKNSWHFVITFISVLLCLLLIPHITELRKPCWDCSSPHKIRVSTLNVFLIFLSLFFSSWMKNQTNSMLKITQEWVLNSWWDGALKVSPCFLWLVRFLQHNWPMELLFPSSVSCAWPFKFLQP